ncbi:MAG: hypothetical protein ACFCBU_15600, partial [Cyanophyceae cyanobacterium]
GIQITGSANAGTNAAPAADFGYAPTGIDVINDFTIGTDQVRLSSSLFGGRLSENNKLLGTSLSTAATRLYYNPATGILFFAEGPAGTEAVFASGTAGVQTPDGVVIAPNLTQPIGAGGGVTTLNFTFAQVGEAFSDQGTFRQPIPLVQVLINNTPVANFSGRDVLFI